MNVNIVLFPSREYIGFPVYYGVFPSFDAALNYVISKCVCLDDKDKCIPVLHTEGKLTYVCVMPPFTDENAIKSLTQSLEEDPEYTCYKSVDGGSLLSFCVVKEDI